MAPILSILPWVAVALLALAGASIVIDTIRYGIGPTPTSSAVRRRLLELAKSFPEATVYELGSGWGTLAFPLAIAIPAGTVVAYEASLVPWLVSKARLSFGRNNNLSVLHRNFFDADLSKADVVVCYLYPKAMELLRTQFEAQLHKGTVVITHTFAVPGWEPESVVRCDDLYRTPIYRYTVK